MSAVPRTMTEKHNAMCRILEPLAFGQWMGLPEARVHLCHAIQQEGGRAIGKAEAQKVLERMAEHKLVVLSGDVAVMRVVECEEKETVDCGTWFEFDTAGFEAAINEFMRNRRPYR